MNSNISLVETGKHIIVRPMRQKKQRLFQTYKVVTLTFKRNLYREIQKMLDLCCKEAHYPKKTTFPKR